MRDARAEQKWMQRLERAGAMIESIDSGGGCKTLPEHTIESIRVLTPCGDRGDVLVVVKARRGEDVMVGFVGGPDVVTALLTWHKRERHGGLQFREDRPYQGG